MSLFMIAGGLLASAVGSFLIVKSQLTKVLKEELEVTRSQVKRLRVELDEMKASILAVSNDNLALISERDYLKSLIITALTTTGTVHKNILTEALDKIDKQTIVSSKKE